MMNNKWLLMLVSICLSIMMLVGCNANNDPAPTENDQNVDQNDDDTDNLPGVDKDDNMLKDDEKDNDPDPEDPVEDAEDMGDNDNKDE
ncbi:hypothetical protein [Metabacillus fastidiosus]|uniref:hypothetical protein n=2 Tax=Metabacillus fastidiosus TaxID=1458 RepID=UPI003AF32DAB